MIHLATNRLIIRDPLPADAEEWHRLLSDPKTMYYLPDIMTRSFEESRDNLECAINESKIPNRTKYFFAIESKATGALIGTIGYTVMQTTPAGKVVGVGYFILPEYHGQGIMTEALREVIRFAFEDGGVYRIETGCITENRASERVMQKCGLIKEAERKAYVWHDGRLKDRVEYRLLRDEWLSSLGAFIVEPISSKNRAAVDALIAESWAGPYIAAHGDLLDTRTHPGYVALDNGAIVGYILYNIADGDCEITVLENLRQKQGIGRALTEAVIDKAKEADCRRVWLITTNDNTHAIRFYQKLNFSLKAVHINALGESRKLKPQIPPIGNDGIPLKHEFEFEFEIVTASNSLDVNSSAPLNAPFFACITIREIEDRDYPEVLKIWNNELGNSYFTAENINLHHKRFKGNENYKAFVAVLDQCVAGVVYIMQYAPWGVAGEQFWIQGIAVRGDLQGKGIGTKLLEHIEKYAKKKGVGYITLNTGFKRTAAHAFYERNGYSSGNYCFGKKL